MVGEVRRNRNTNTVIFLDHLKNGWCGLSFEYIVAEKSTLLSWQPELIAFASEIREDYDFDVLFTFSSLLQWFGVSVTLKPSGNSTSLG